MWYLIWAGIWSIIGYYIGLQMQPVAEISGAIIGFTISSTVYILSVYDAPVVSFSDRNFDFNDQK